MNEAKRKRLEDAGFRVGSVADFLGLSVEESELVEIKVALSSALKKQRGSSSLSQSQLAAQIGSSQSRVAKMEAGDASVSIDLLVRALVAQGMTRQELADVLAPPHNYPVLVSPGKVVPVPRGDSNTHYSLARGSKRRGLEDYSGKRQFPNV